MGITIQEIINKLLTAKTSSFGVPPGTLIESKESIKAKVSLVKYNQNDYSQEEITNLDLLTEKINLAHENQVAWLDIDSVCDTETLQKIGEIYKIHPLTLEDIANVHQRPKLEDGDGYLYLVLNVTYIDPINKEIAKEQISFILAEQLLITFQERPNDVFDIIRRRLTTARGRLRKMSADYLLYTLLDVILDNYFIVLSHANEQINQLSLRINEDPDNKTIYQIQKLKQELLTITRYILPTKELLWDLMKTEAELIQEANEIYFKDLSDHVLQINESLEILKDSLAGLLQYANSTISNKLNEIMKVLTVVSTVLIPLNFIASIYGMNFKHMPELDYQFSYYIVLAVMFGLGLIMLAYFRVKKWI